MSGHRDPATGRPKYADKWADCRAAVADALENREDHYPAMIARGQITEVAADEDIAAWRDLAIEWAWIDSQGRTGFRINDDRVPAMLAAVDRMIARIERARDPKTGALEPPWGARRLIADALRWQLTENRRAMRLTVDLNTECRRRHGRDQQQDQNLCQAA